MMANTHTLGTSYFSHDDNDPSDAPQMTYFFIIKPGPASTEHVTSRVAECGQLESMPRLNALTVSGQLTRVHYAAVGFLITSSLMFVVPHPGIRKLAQSYLIQCPDIHLK